MATYQWDLKSNYMLAFTVCKYGQNPERWTLIANDLVDYINATPQSCKAQFDVLCQQYGQDWRNVSAEPPEIYIFSIIKHMYYTDSYQRMTESQDLLMVMYDFIRLFKSGRMSINDINDILQNAQETSETSVYSASTGISPYDHERQQKLKILKRLKSHLTRQFAPASDAQQSSFPVELLPPPPFFPQQHSIITNHIPQVVSNDTDRQVPSIDVRQKLASLGIPSFPLITQSNNLFTPHAKQSSNNNQSNDVDIDEIELSSDDDDDHPLSPPPRDQTAAVHISTIDEPTVSSHLDDGDEDDDDESTYLSDEQIETNESSNILPIRTEISTSDDRDLYETISRTSVSNQSTYDTRLSNGDRAPSSINGQPTSSGQQLNASVSGSSDYITLDDYRGHSVGNRHHGTIDTDSIVTTPRRIPIDDDEVARMDAEQVPEPIPADVADVTVPNDNAVFVLDGSDSNNDIPPMMATIDEYNVRSDMISQENNEFRMTKTSFRQPQASTVSHNLRKSINSILNNLKDAKYGPDFAKPLRSFKLPDEYYFRVKKPLDIPEIRERMNNGDYDENVLLFERDVLLMFTNALSMYHRDLDIHGHAQYMINYAMELLTSIEEFLAPWKNDDHENGDNSSRIIYYDDENDSNDDSMKLSPGTRTSSIASTPSSVRVDSSMRNPRRQSTANHPMRKRQRKSTH